MPRHTHNGYTDPGYCAVPTGDNNVWKQIIQYKNNTGYSDGYHFEFTGGSQPHNNMPPYITVYMWKRTA